MLSRPETKFLSLSGLLSRERGPEIDRLDFSFTTVVDIFKMIDAALVGVIFPVVGNLGPDSTDFSALSFFVEIIRLFLDFNGPE